MSLFLEQHRSFLLLLKRRKVDFIIVGGYAVIYHGYERTTGDLDLWLKPTNINRDRFVKAMKEHGVTREGLDAITEFDFTNPQSLYIGQPPLKIDFLTRIQGPEYDEAEEEAERIKLNGYSIHILNLDHLIATKLLAGRLKDKADVDVLQKIDQHRKEQ